MELLGFNIPVSMGTSAGSMASSTIWFFIFVFFIILILGVCLFLLNNMRTYKYKIILFENISGMGFQVAGKDRARIVKIGDGGEEILYLQKRKIYRTAYGKKMGKNTYWFAVGQDGYWYNIVLGDVDAKLGMLDIKPIDRDLRYMHVAIRKNIQERYRKQNFMEKYGMILMNGFFLVIMLIGMWFIMDKIQKTSTGIATGVETSNKVIESTNEILGKLDNICMNSGVKDISEVT